MNETVHNSGSALMTQPSTPALRELAGHSYPIVYIKARSDQKEQFQEIMALDDIAYVEQALGIGTLMTGAIRIENGQFDAARARQLIVDHNESLPPDKKKYSLTILNTYQSTQTQEHSLVSAMIDKILEVLKNAIGVALGQTSIAQVTAAVTDAFTNLNSQQGDAWIFWEKTTGSKTVYSYAILFAIQDELTGKLMVAFPMSLKIEVNVEFERVLWITLKNRESYAVQIDAMKIGQLLFPKSSPTGDIVSALARAERSAVPEAGGTQDGVAVAAVAIGNIRVSNWSRTVLFATAAAGDLDQNGTLLQIITGPPVLHHMLVEESRYIVSYTLNGVTHHRGFIYNGRLPGGELWFVSV